MEMKYSHKEDNRYHFCLDIDFDHRIYFYTYRDLSGFHLSFDVGNPRDWITAGIEILINMKFIESEVNKH